MTKQEATKERKRRLAIIATVHGKPMRDAAAFDRWRMPYCDCSRCMMTHPLNV
jgi:hypothetical protein